MQLLLAFAPFFAFVVVERLAGTLPGLAAGALVSVCLLIRDGLLGHGRVKLLELGTTLLFSGLLGWGLRFGVDAWSIAGVRLRVDLGLLAIVLASVAVGRPFTLQYAPTPTGQAVSAAAMRAHVVISLVWAAAFAAMVAADLLLIYLPEVPVRVAVIVTVVALLAAAKFSKWYPSQLR